MNQQQLLILDLDETLIAAHERPDALPYPHDFTGVGYYVWKRPHLDAFLAQVFTWFTVAVWTASSRTYAAEIVRQVFPDPDQLHFCWDRTRCTRRYNTEQAHYYWVKNLNKVKRVTQRPLEQMLLLDDSPEKAEQHYGNLLPITPFTGDPTDTELGAILPYLDWIRTVENTRIIEKRYWRAWVPPTPQPPKRGLDR